MPPRDPPKPMPSPDGFASTSRLFSLLFGGPLQGLAPGQQPTTLSKWSSATDENVMSQPIGSCRRLSFKVMSSNSLTTACPWSGLVVSYQTVSSSNLTVKLSPPRERDPSSRLAQAVIKGISWAGFRRFGSFGLPYANHERLMVKDLKAKCRRHPVLTRLARTQYLWSQMSSHRTPQCGARLDARLSGPEHKQLCHSPPHIPLHHKRNMLGAESSQPCVLHSLRLTLGPPLDNIFHKPNILQLRLVLSCYISRKF